jgi:hypothetical protein
MSAVVEAPLDLLGADIVETETGRKVKQASATRWVWQPFKDIPLFDNLDPAVRNSLTLREKRRADGQVVSDPVQVLRRCQPYPLVNCEYEVPVHEAMRYDYTGGEVPENDLPGTYSGPDPKATGAPRHKVEFKYAYSSARELSEMYAKEFGLVVLEPLTDCDDASVVRQVFELVQPVTYRLHTLEAELRKAEQAVRESRAPKEVKALAEGCRVLMLKGCRAAMLFAQERMTDFAQQIQQAGAGHKGHRSFPAPYDEFVAEQLGVEVPRVVQVEKRSSTNDELLAKLAEKELARGGENDPLVRALESEREERRRLEAKVDALLAAQQNGAGPQKGAQK